jgi:hypothetical protein
VTSRNVADMEEVDYEYLTNNKIVASTISVESYRIADNYLDDSVFPKLTRGMMSKI